ncbi:hypothetical protein RHS01_08217 [Rhizoctonia solani]|uniref:Uncharacterized protein n=1 Tax=Rhizoctonia solani TaxID=456999 RepID=A0A8H7M1T2_9AGAM|nr:hypothetical protein RHS01_08217 [Rhizoctonia solani]
MEMLPSYSPEVLPGYELTPTASITSSSGPRSSLSPSHSSYIYRSARMELDLGPQRWGTRLPAYGRGGMVQGTVAVRTFRHVDKVVVRRLRLLLVQRRRQLPFFVVLEGDDEAARPIPASGSTQLTRAQASVAYVVRSSNRDLYIPRTISRLLPPIYAELGNEKRPQISESEWHSDDLLLERSRTSSEPSAGYKSEAVLPVAAQSRRSRDFGFREICGTRLENAYLLCYPFRPAADSGSDIESGIEVQLVRVSTIQTRAGVVQQASTVCRGRIQPSRDQGRTRTLRGTIDTGSAGKLELEL